MKVLTFYAYSQKGKAFNKVVTNSSERKQMSKKQQKEKKNCKKKQGLMLAFGITTLGARVLSAISLAAIALSFCYVKQESKVFNNCVEEIRASGKDTATAVRFCNGG